MFNHHGYLSNFVKININTGKYNVYCTTTMASPNEDSLHGHESNANPTYMYIIVFTIKNAIFSYHMHSRRILFKWT